MEARNSKKIANKRTCLPLVCAIIITNLCVSPSSKAQQDPLYSQYMFNMLAINPAYSGINNNLNVSVNSRFQWGGLEGSPKTYTLTANSGFFANKIGLGAIVLRDELGVNQNTEFHLAYSYKISSPDFALSFGLQTGIINYRYNYSELRLKYLDDPDFVPVMESATKVNFGFGIAYKREDFFAGLSIPRILNRNFDDGVSISTRYERHIYATAAFLLRFKPGLQLKPMVLVKGVQGAPVSFDLHASVIINNLMWAGIFTRDLNSYGLMVQLEIKHYKIGYSFELPNKDFAATNLLTHEIMLSLDIEALPDHIVMMRFF
jgi:type IX secretion system PorP/SprF family membrane protein